MSDTVIRVENVSKLYRLGEIGTGTLSHDFNRWWHRIRGKEDPYLKIGQTNDRTKKADSDYSWALKDINFEVKRGEVLGIIGRNGAGKSTLLKILSRVTTPTTGEIKIKGRIASLLEVGTGFNPELTGRDNIYLNGAILGMRKREIDRKFDEIVDFSGVERYVDTPVKRYSSGMYVRLAFAVAAFLEPETLIVDEVLAVGDGEFQKKCLGKMKEVSRNQGRTVLFVSHNLQAVRNLCTRCLVLCNGAKKFEGDTAPAFDAYQGQDDHSGVWLYDSADFKGRISGGESVRIEQVSFVSKRALIKFGDKFEIQIQANAVEDLDDSSFDITFFNVDGIPVGTSFSMKGVDIRRGRNVHQLTISPLRLAPGKYYCDVAIIKGSWLCSGTFYTAVLSVLYFEVEFPTTQEVTVPSWDSARWGSTVQGDISVLEVQKTVE